MNLMTNIHEDNLDEVLRLRPLPVSMSLFSINILASGTERLLHDGLLCLEVCQSVSVPSKAGAGNSVEKFARRIVTLPALRILSLWTCEIPLMLGPVYRSPLSRSLQYLHLSSVETM